MNLQKIRYINCCIVEFGKKFSLASRWAFQKEELKLNKY